MLVTVETVVAVVVETMVEIEVVVVVDVIVLAGCEKTTAVAIRITAMTATTEAAVIVEAPLL